MEIRFKPSKKQFQAWEILTDKTTTELGFGGGACFRGDTLVLTKEGYKKIREIKKGETVCSFNESKNILEWKKVLNTFVFGGGAEEQEMVELGLYGERIVATTNHRFYIGGNWVPIGEFAKRVLAKNSWTKRLVLHFDDGASSNKKLEKQQEGCLHEASPRQEGVFTYDVGLGEWKSKDSKASSPCGSNVLSQYGEQAASKPQKQEEGRQSGGELGMGKSVGELGSLQFIRGLREKQCLVFRKSAKELCERVKGWYVAFKRGGNKRDQKSFCAKEDGKKCTSQKVWRIPSHDQGHHPTEKLEARSLDSVQIESVRFLSSNEEVFDLEVEDNSNFIVSKSNIIVHNSGGKSYLGCFWILSMCLAYPGTGWLIGRKEMINLRRTTLVTLFKICAEYGIDSKKDMNFNQQTNIITFPNGSQIFLFDLSYQPSDPLYTRLGSLELTGAFVDESNEVDGQAIEILKTRLGRRKNDEYGMKPKLLETFNPDKGHVYQKYFKPWKEGTLPPHRQFIRALITDNPYAPFDYVNQLKNADKVTQQRLLYGNFDYDDDPMRLMAYDAINDLWSNTIVQDGEKYITADIARFGDDKTVIGYWEGLCLKNVITREKLGTDEVANAIRILARDNRVPYSNIIVDEDGIGGGVKDQLGGVKGFIANTVPFQGPELHKPENFANLKAQCTFKLAQLVNERRIAIEHIEAEFRSKLSEELDQIKAKGFDKDGKKNVISKDEIKTNLGRSPDRSDMVMMRMWFECKPKQKVFTQEPQAQAPLHVYGRRQFGLPQQTP